MKKAKSIVLLSLLTLTILVSCNSEVESNDVVVNTGKQTTSYTANTSSRDITSNDDAMTESFEETVIVTLSDSTASCFGSNCTITTDTNLISITYNKEQNVTFDITGALTNYGLKIETNKKYKTKIILNGVTITTAQDSVPCLNFDTKTTLYLEIKGANTFSDGRRYGKTNTETTKGSLYSKGALILSGDGSLSITEGYKHAVASKDYIKVNGGTYNITSSGRNGFQAVNGFIMNSGNITINGSGENTNNESRGIVVEGEESYTYMGEGFIVINGGTLNITTVSKGITAKWDSDSEDNDGDAKDTDKTNDPYPYVKITGGTINITTTGSPYEGKSAQSFTDADGETVTEIKKLSPEGIEGKQAVFISGGNLTLNCTDDCINSSANGSADITISGGNIYACSSENDAIDSNGNLTISGGNVVAITTHSPECAFDCDEYTFAITGGNVAGIGTSNYSEPTPSACNKQGVLVLSSSYLGSKNKTIAVKDSSGNVKFAFTLPDSISNTKDLVGIFSSPNLTSGSYTLNYGATASPSVSNFNGLYTSMPTVSEGSSKSGISFSSSYVYTLGTTNNQGSQEGARPEGPQPMH